MDKRPINILIVDDSRVSREMLSHIFESDPDLKVIETASNGEDALHWLKTNSPDVITMDILMPNIDGFEVTRRVMETKPIPIVIISAAYSPQDSIQAFRAMEAGALAIIPKPSGFGDTEYLQKTKEIIDTVKTIADIKLVKRRVRASVPGQNKQQQLIQSEVIGPVEAVAIGASLGGPAAISVIISQLPASFPVPIFIVQHIARGFTPGLVSWLQGYTVLPVHLAEQDLQAQPGCIYVAPDGYHMEIKNGGIINLTSTPDDGLRPSVGRLFKSMAETYGARAIGVILTGMGKDGAKELFHMRKAGAQTIAQDADSCIVFGMPQEAIALGAAQHIIPLNMIAEALNVLVLKSRHKQDFNISKA